MTLAYNAIPSYLCLPVLIPVPVEIDAVPVNSETIERPTYI